MKLVLPVLILLVGLVQPGVSQDNVSLGDAKKAFEKADAELNQIYQKARAELPEYEFVELQKEQRDWLEYRDYRSKTSAVYDGGGVEGKEMENSEFWLTSEAVTKTRIRIINGLINADSFGNKTWDGVWEDGSGGLLQIYQKEDGSIIFFTECVRGPTYHNGVLAGAAVTNGNMARFSKKIPGEEGEVWLTFNIDGKRLKLVGTNTSHYHGMRAYFDGTYIRVAKVDIEKLKGEVENFESTE